MIRRLLPILAVLAVLVAGCGDDDDTADAGAGAEDTSTTTEAPTTDDGYGGGGPTTTATSGGGGGSAVTIADFAFDPGTIEVPAGTAVTWTNGDGVGHTVTAGTPDAPEEHFDEAVDGGGEAEVTFDEAGTFAYFCRIHPTMTGEVVVS